MAWNQGIQETNDQRNASEGSITVDITATASMAACALLAWWFQRYIRGLYELAIQKSVVKVGPSPEVGGGIPLPGNLLIVAIVGIDIIYIHRGIYVLENITNQTA
jgi:hypothetical protein